MNDELVQLLTIEIKKYDELIKKINKKYYYYKPLYNLLSSSKNNKNPFSNRKTYEIFVEKMKHDNSIAINKLINNKLLYDTYNSNVNKKLSEFNLSKNILYSNAFMNRIKNDVRLKKVYNELDKMKQTDELLCNLNREIETYLCDCFFNIFDEIVKEKQRLNEDKKQIEYALKNYQSNQNLNDNNISTIKNIIISKTDNEDDKNRLLNILNSYVLKFSAEKKKENNEPKQEQVSMNYVDDNSAYYYYDDNKKESNTLYKNYLTTIRSFDNYDDINEFLESIKYDYDIKLIIFNIIGLLTNTSKDLLIKEQLNKYLQSLDDTLSDVITDKENIIFYYGFLWNKNKVLADVEKGNIPKEYYPDILTGIDMIKNNTARIKGKSIVKIKKVFKIRINNIRITYKMLSDNLYIILGIFCKKDKKGYNVTNTTIDRNNELIGSEKAIINARNVECIWDEYLKINSEFEDELLKLLKSKTKK